MSRPPFDPALDAALSALGGQAPPITPETIPNLREAPLPIDIADEALEKAGLVRRDIKVAGHEGAGLAATAVARADHAGAGPGILHLHGGGMISGHRMLGIDLLVPWVVEHDAVVVTPEYRLAPEFPDPFPVEDSYAALAWTAEHAAELGIDPARLLVAGASAGGGLAAGTALLARDRGGPELIGQVLLSPMLDDRDATVSTRQYDDVGTWLRESNRTAWSALLGERRGTDDVSIYAAPARATDLAGLPPAFIDCGSAEVFRDEDVAYASALWAAGVQAELHVWPGACHGFDALAPRWALVREAAGTRNAWVARLLTG